MGITVKKIKGAFAIKITTSSVTLIKVGDAKMVAQAFGVDISEKSTPEEIIAEVAASLNVFAEEVEIISLAEIAQYNGRPDVKIF